MNQLICQAIIMAFLLCACMAECPPDDAVVKVDPEKLSGEWFVVAVFTPMGPPVLKCGHIDITSPSPTTINMKYDVLQTSDGTPLIINVNATINDKFVGTWEQQSPPAVIGTFDHRLVTVDYGSHLLMVSCSIEPESEDLYLMICSRQKTLSPAILSDLKSKAGKYVDDADIWAIDQTC